jgi:DNA-binding NtrC family response regulator
MKNRGRIFLLDDEELIVSMLSKALKKDGHEVRSETSTHDIIQKIKSFTPDIVLLDINLPDRNGIDILKEIRDNGIITQVVMLTADDTAETAVKAMKLGAADYLTKPFNREELKIVLHNILERGSLKEEVVYLRKAYSEFFDKDMIGESGEMKGLRKKIEKIAQAGVSSVLVTGESGTGKEIVARNIHNIMFTGRSGYTPFICINCAAMPETLLESELFGYMKGSFTDAKSDKKGLFEMSKDGSILLDEIGEMQPSLQSKLLRVLEERVVRRIGGKEEIPIDVTVIATTNRNLMEAVEKGQFRSDLFFRLSAFNLHIPPLRDRAEDIPLLTKYFLSNFAVRYNKKEIKGVSPESEKIMLSYKWPGNVRELKNVVERIVVLENTELIQPEHLPNWLAETSTVTYRSSENNNRFILPESGISLDELEKDLMVQALERTNYNRTSAAKLLKVSYDTFRYQMKKLGVK